MDVIKELGLDIYHFDKQECVLADDLRDLIDKLPVVYGKKSFVGSPDFPDQHQVFEITDQDKATHKARLIGIEKLVKEPIKIQFESTVTNHGAQFYDSNKMTELRGKRVRVTVEEVIE